MNHVYIDSHMGASATLESHEDRDYSWRLYLRMLDLVGRDNLISFLCRDTKMDDHLRTKAGRKDVH